MQIITIVVAILAVSLAAPTEDVKVTHEKVVVPEKPASSEPEKSVEKVEPVKQSSDLKNDEKPVNENTEEKVEEEKVSEDKIEEPEVKITEEKEPVVVVAATTVEKKKTDDVDHDKDDEDDDIISEEEREKNRREYSAICRASTGATEEQIKATGKDVEDASKEVKCYIKCMAEEYGIEKDQVVQKEVAKRNRPSSLSGKEMEDIVDTCGSLQTDDPCDSAYLRYSCFFRTSGGNIRLH